MIRTILVSILYMIALMCMAVALTAWARQDSPLTYTGILTESETQGDSSWYLATTDGKPILTLQVPEWVALELGPFRKKKIRIIIDDSSRVLQEIPR